MRIPATTLVLALILAWPATAEVYRVVDSQGRVTYTDSPPKDGRQFEKVELEELNTQQAIEPVPSLAPNSGRAGRDEPAEEFIDYVVQLTSPPDGAQVPPGQRDLPIAARVSPPLADGHAIQFFLNGEPLAPPSLDTGLVIEEIYRGAHRISARVVDEDDRVLVESDPVQVFVHRPTRNSPAR